MLKLKISYATIHYYREKLSFENNVNTEFTQLHSPLALFVQFSCSFVICITALLAVTRHTVILALTTPYQLP